MLDFILEWHGRSLEDAWKFWSSSKHFGHIKALGLIHIWGIWLARNSSIFWERASSTKAIAKQGIYILSFFPQTKDSLTIRIISEELFDFSFPWALFDDASQDRICGGGATLFLISEPSIQISNGVRGRNEQFC